MRRVAMAAKSYLERVSKRRSERKKRHKVSPKKAGEEKLPH